MNELPQLCLDTAIVRKHSKKLKMREAMEQGGLPDVIWNEGHPKYNNLVYHRFRMFIRRIKLSKNDSDHDGSVPSEVECREVFESSSVNSVLTPPSEFSSTTDDNTTNRRRKAPSIPLLDADQTTNQADQIVQNNAPYGGNEDNQQVLPPPAKKKRYRRTSTQVAADRAAECRSKNATNIAFARATTLYAEHKHKPRSDKSKLSLQKIVDLVNEQYGTTITKSRVADYVKRGAIGIAPTRAGPKRRIPEQVFKALCEAISSYIILVNAEKMKQPGHPELKKHAKLCVEKSGICYKDPDFLIDSILKEISAKIDVSHKTLLEHRRAIWTTYVNLNIFFDDYKKLLLEKKFATPAEDGDEGEVHIEPDQLHRIINLDESEVSIDGTNKLCGGRPGTTYAPSDKSLPTGATATNKAQNSATVICGSCASGYPVPPATYFPTKATKTENMKPPDGAEGGLMYVKGYWGLGRLTALKATIGANPKGGMDQDEFAKYLMECIINRLFPDVRDVPGKRVLLILDSGPGRDCEELLAKLRVKGVYIILGVPNSTHVTQVTDQNFGLFKSEYRANLQDLTEYCSEEKLKGRSKSVRNAHIPYIFFGKSPSPFPDFHFRKKPFEHSFSVERSQACWAKTGIYPLTRRCLSDPKVMRQVVIGKDGEVDLEADPVAEKLLAQERLNYAACDALNYHGYDGDRFRKKAPRLDLSKDGVAIKITSDMPLEEQVEIMSTCNKAGKRFKAVGCEELNSDKFFLGKQRGRDKVAIKDLEKKKKNWESYKEKEEAGLAILKRLEEEHNIQFERLSVESDDFKKKVRVPDLTAVYKWKVGKSANQKSKPDMLAAIKERWNSPAKPDEYKDEDKNKLEELKSSALDLSRTALGKAKQDEYNNVLNGFQALSDEQRAQMLAELTNDEVAQV